MQRKSFGNNVLSSKTSIFVFYKKQYMNISNIRLLNQQLVNPQMSDVHELVAWMGMLQAQEYTMMRWAVGIRLKKPSMSLFRKAYDSGQVVRAHLFRCTWQLVAAEDLRWMLKLCSQKNKKTIRYYGHGISEKDFEYACDLICQALSAHQSMTKKAIIDRLGELGLSGDTYTMTKYLQMAEVEGLICSGYLDDNQNTYALVEGRIPLANELSREESIILLARKYFRSHSPATLKDFAWWTNLSTGECKNAINSIANELTAECYNDDVYYIHQDCRTKGCCKKILLLPSYDEYLIGYKSRHHAIAERFCQQAYNKNVFYPVIVQNGDVIGNWHPYKKANFFEDGYKVDLTRLLLDFHKFMDC